MRPPPKTVAEWTERRRKEKGIFVVDRELYHSPAFAALREKNPAHALVMFEVLDQLNLEPKKKREHKRRRGYKNGGIVELPQTGVSGSAVNKTGYQL